MAEEKDMCDLVEDFCDIQNIYRWEGEQGLRDFVSLIEAIGYGDSWGHTLNSFLADNPGCVEAMVEWVGEQGNKCDEWKESIIEAMHGPADE